MASKYFEKLCAAIARTTPFRQVLSKPPPRRAPNPRCRVPARSAISTAIARKPGKCKEFLQSQLQNTQYNLSAPLPSPAPRIGATRIGIAHEFATPSKPPYRTPISPYVNNSFHKQLMNNSSFNTTKRAVITCRSICNRCVDNDEKEEDCSEDEKLDSFDLSTWSFPADCCKRACKDLPRYDELFWQPSDKKKRIYQQTWSDCKMICKPKVVCSVKTSCQPPMVKRIRCPKECASSCDQAKFNAICQLGTTRCPRLTMPCCKVARFPPSCRVFRGPKPCCKTKCPYPSFSECRHKKLTKPPPVECACSKIPSQCELMRMRERLAQIQASLDQMSRYF